MQAAISVDLVNKMQPEIEHLLDQLQAAGITMRLLGNAEAYMRIAQHLGCWIDPACAQQMGGVEASPFWLEFNDADGATIAIAAAFHCTADDILPLIASGHMWYPGGFADHCALSSLHLADPSRLVGQSFSYHQLALNTHIETPQTFIGQMALLVQALAFRHHQSRFAVQLGVYGPEIPGVPLLLDCYQVDDFLACTYFPPAEARASLTLLSSRAEEFLTIAHNRHERAAITVAREAAAN